MKDNVILRREDGDRPNPAHVEILTEAVCGWFVRKDSKFHEAENLTTRLWQDDLQRICLHRFREEFQDIEVSISTLREVFRRAIEQKHAAPGQSIPVWNGGIVCKPLEGRERVRSANSSAACSARRTRSPRTASIS